MGALNRYIVKPLAVLAILLWAAVCVHDAWAAPALAGHHYRVGVVARSASHAGGRPLDLAYVVMPDPGWHIYWTNPGDTGYAPRVDWQLPSGWRAGPIVHPSPQRLVVAGLSSNIHGGRTILTQRLVGPSADVRLKGTLDLLLCSADSCVPDPLDFVVALPAGDNAPDPAAAGIFAAAAAARPQPGPDGARFVRSGAQLRLLVPGLALPAGARPRLFAAAPDLLEETAAQTVRQKADGLEIVARAGRALGDALPVVLEWTEASGATRAIALTARAAGAEPASPAAAVAFATALGGAFLGGLLLNLMPCVFPILSLKALSLARSGETPAAARAEAIGYTLGATAVVMALGAALLVLRGLGHQLGWAFQLQDPRVLLLLLLLVVAIATNLAGLFELPTPAISGAGGHGFRGALATGALAAFIATPCTGPFMAGALGAALVMPPAAAMAVFLGLGLGLSAPFLLIGFSPAARRRLPRPGPWMLTLRRLLSLPMFATALGLLWIIGRQQGIAAMTTATALALVLGLGLWWQGLRQQHSPGFLPAGLAMAATIAGIFFGPVATLPARPAAAAVAEEAFSPARLAALQAAGRPVFLYLTAEWCLTCKVNEATSLHADAVRARFARAHVVVMRGDWTGGDPAITAFLHRNGKAGVPAYYWYPARGERRELPQILTPAMLEQLPS
jgi:thiol:disulfide interchange protein